MLPGLGGGNVSGEAAAAATPPSITYTATDKGKTTYNNMALGTVASTRRIIVAVSSCRIDSTSPSAHSSVTVAGVSCTKLADRSASSASAGFRTTLWITNSAISSGSTGQIVISAGTISFVGIMVWAAYDLASITPHDTETAAGTGALSVSIDCPENGILVSAAQLNAVTGTLSWSGATENVDTDNSYVKIGGASISGTTSETGRTVTATQSSSSALNGTMVAATLL